MARPAGLIILDRDGVLNELVVDPEQGTVNSPLHPDQVRLIDRAAEAVRLLSDKGYALAIATNQPAAAKFTATMANLRATHDKVVSLLEAGGARIGSSHICFHKREDSCSCRKPKPGLLREALESAGFAGGAEDKAWMVGDGVTDVQAGVAAGMKTAYVGPRRCDHCRYLEAAGVYPDRFVDSLWQFAESID